MPKSRIKTYQRRGEDSMSTPLPPWLNPVLIVLTALEPSWRAFFVALHIALGLY